MSDMLHEGAAWFAAQIHEHASRPVIYRRGSERVSPDPKGSFATQRRDAEQQNGFYLQSNYQAVLMLASELTIRGERVLPETGDLIEDPTNGKTYEVTAPDLESCYRPADPAHLMLRIHTLER